MTNTNVLERVPDPMKVVHKETINHTAININDVTVSFKGRKCLYRY